jgi:hypothetical protein
MTTPIQPVPAAQITIVDVYTRQVEMNATLATIQEQLKAIPDHEQRIRALERWRYSLPMAFVSAAASVALSVWAVLHP